jgi:hypothetical protein
MADAARTGNVDCMAGIGLRWPFGAQFFGGIGERKNLFDLFVAQIGDRNDTPHGFECA